MSVNDTAQKRLCLFFLIGCLLLSIVLQSRSFVIGFVVGVAAFFFLTGENKLNIRHYIVAASLLVGFAVILAFMTKTDSTYGRLLIYKVSFLMFSEHWLHGIGFGSFRSKYLLYQANYFAEGKQTQVETMLASNTYYVFNDYWQFVIEGGITAFFVLAVGICGLGYLFLLNRRKYQERMPNMLKLAWSFLIAILLAAVFTHVWEKTTYQLLIVGLIAVILYFSFVWGKNVTRKLFFLGIAFVFVLILFFGNIDRLLYYKAYSTSQEAERYCFAGYMGEGLELFNKVYPQLKHDVIYLTMYAYQCKKNQNFERALTLFREAAAIRPSNELYRQLGICYDRLGDFERAEYNFILAINMVPNRFIPRYELFSFYKSHGFLDKARETGAEIMSLPVKVPSSKVNHVKSSVENEMKEQAYVN